MSPDTPGLHHVTAIAGDPQRNAKFYVDTLGLRFVKRTVNHDDTGTYHFYFGEWQGTPGTTITFFHWTEDGRQGKFGAGQTRAVAYLIRPDAVEYWRERLETRGVDVAVGERFGDTVLRFEDPDGIGLELVASDAPTDAEPWAESSVPDANQLRGFHSVTLAVEEVGPTETILTEVLGYELEAAAKPETEHTCRHRYRVEGSGPGSALDLVETDAGRGRMGVGTVHHVAFMADSTEAEQQYRESYVDHGMSPSEIIDRKYFQSIYAREPGGVLFEIATTDPGFTVDEDLDELGERLVLPESLEGERNRIESELPAFDPAGTGGGARTEAGTQSETERDAAAEADEE